MAYIRFPIPAFDHKALRGLEWSPPDLLDRGAMTTANCKQVVQDATQ